MCENYFKIILPWNGDKEDTLVPTDIEVLSSCKTLTSLLFFSVSKCTILAMLSLLCLLSVLLSKSKL